MKSISRQHRKNNQSPVIAVTLLIFSSCSTLKPMLGMNDQERNKPISNPFFASKSDARNESNPPMILRTKKGDRSVELEIPGDAQKLSDFVLPVSPAFKNDGRSLASSDNEQNSSDSDNAYKNHLPAIADREIIQSFSKGSQEDESKRSDIEQALNLRSSDDASIPDGNKSYLAATDHVKQLYRANRFEAALLELDDIVKQYPTDPKLYEMRGTLLDRMGRGELALKSWNQAVRLDPKNSSLKKFIERKQGRNIAGVQ